MVFERDFGLSFGFVKLVLSCTVVNFNKSVDILDGLVEKDEATEYANFHKDGGIRSEKKKMLIQIAYSLRPGLF